MVLCHNARRREKPDVPGEFANIERKTELSSISVNTEISADAGNRTQDLSIRGLALYPTTSTATQPMLCVRASFIGMYFFLASVTVKSYQPFYANSSTSPGTRSSGGSRRCWRR